MILAVDVYYYKNKAKVVGVLFKDWKDSQPFDVKSIYVNEIAPYESGSFYKRELPCIISLLNNIDLTGIEFIVVDSFVYINDDKKLGLAGYLYEYFNGKIAVIGVAKNSFHLNEKNVKKVYRGKSKKPLYISSIGRNLSSAVLFISSMFGDYRFPTLLKTLDQETRNIAEKEM